MRRLLPATIRATLATLVGGVFLAGCMDSGDGSMDDDDTTESGITVTEVSQSGDFMAPLDAIPDADATTFYFVGGSSQGPGVFRVSSAGGSVEGVSNADSVAQRVSTVQVVSEDDTYVAPCGIGISSDHTKLYVADPESFDGAGAVLSVNISDGAVGLVTGTLGTGARALDVVATDGGDQIYFTGMSLPDLKPAVLQVPAAGGTATAIAKGDPLVYPYGVMVSSAGILYVSDSMASGEELGKVFMIEDGVVSTIVEQVITGDPAGIALTKDEATLLVSSINPDTDTDQVLLVDTATYATSTFSEVIGANTSGGGLHRSSGSNTFAWADSKAGGSGKVYSISF